MPARGNNSPLGAPREPARADVGGYTATNFNPGQLIADVEEGAARLEDAAEKLHDATERFETAEADYERAMQTQLIVIYHQAKETGERLPAEDIRRALAHQAINSNTYGNYLEAKAEKEALAVKYRALSAAVSARQSLLKALSA